MTTPSAAREPAPAAPSAVRPQRPPSGPRALEVARADLQRELDPRYVQFPSFAHAAGSEPLVVPLGAADRLGDVVADPYAMVRSRATLHLTGRAVLVGPWGGGRAETEPSACGLCLGLHWQRLRSGPEREARQWGHDPQGGEERPHVAPLVVDVVRTVWSTVFGSPGLLDPGADPAGAGEETQGSSPPAAVADGRLRVTCVDLRVPVPRSYLLLPEDSYGLHTGCRG